MAFFKSKALMDDDLYARLGKTAATENRSIRQQVLYLIRADLAWCKGTRNSDISTQQQEAFRPYPGSPLGEPG